MSQPRPPSGGPSARLGWRGADLLKGALILGAVWVGLQLLWLAHAILFVIFLGLLLGLGLAAGADGMARWGVPRGVGVAAIVLGFLGVLVLGGALVAPTVQEQGERLRVEVPQALDKLGRWLDEGGPGLRQFFREGLRNDRDDPEEDEEGDERPDEEEDQAPDAGPQAEGAEEPQVEPDEEATSEVLRSRLTEELAGLAENLFSFLESTTTVLAGILLTLFVSIYFAVSPDTYRRVALLLVHRRRQEVVSEVLDEAGILLRRWLVTQGVAMLVIGTSTTIVLMLLGVPAALALGVLAGLLEFIPIVGPIIAAIPAIAMGFLVSPQTGLYVLVAYVVLQQLESQLLVPLLMNKGIDLPPLFTVVIQALMVLVFGFIGLLVAVPFMAAVIVAVKILYLREVLGHEVSLPSKALTTN